MLIIMQALPLMSENGFIHKQIDTATTVKKTTNLFVCATLSVENCLQDFHGDGTVLLAKDACVSWGAGRRVKRGSEPRKGLCPLVLMSC